MSPGKLVLINRPKICGLIESDLGDNPSHTVGTILNNARRRLDSLKAGRGCGCKKGPQRNSIYDSDVEQLRNLDENELMVLKDYLNATTLNLGQGYQV